jgi:hypothetical protein
LQYIATPDFDESHWIHQLYMQAPIAIGIYTGKEHVIELANPLMCELWGRSIDKVINTSLFKALPEVAQQGFEEILSDVLGSGIPFVGNELPATLNRKANWVLLILIYFTNLCVMPRIRS